MTALDYAILYQFNDLSTYLQENGCYRGSEFNASAHEEGDQYIEEEPPESIGVADSSEYLDQESSRINDITRSMGGSLKSSLKSSSSRSDRGRGRIKFKVQVEDDDWEGTVIE